MAHTKKGIAAAMLLAASFSAQAGLSHGGHGGGCGDGGGSSDPVCTAEWQAQWAGSPVLLSKDGATKSKELTFDITLDGFVVGEDVVNDYEISLALADDQVLVREKEWSWVKFKWVYQDVYKDDSGDEKAQLSGSGYNQSWEVNLNDYGFDATLQGIASLNANGSLAVTLTATKGDFWLNGATLAACGIDNQPEEPEEPPVEVPEPATFGLAALGLLALRASRRNA